MPSIIIKDANGASKVITDIAPYIAARDQIVRRLEQIYAGYEQRPANAFIPHEATICELVNSYREHTAWIEQFAAEEQRLANIRAGYDLLQQLREDRP